MSRVNTKPSGWIPFRFPGRIQMLSRSKAERAMQLEIGRRIKRRCHVSATRAAKDVLPYIRIIFKNNIEMAAGMAKWLDLSPEMIEYLAENEKKAEEIKRLIAS